MAVTLNVAVRPSTTVVLAGCVIVWGRPGEVAPVLEPANPPAHPPMAHTTKNTTAAPNPFTIDSKRNDEKNPVGYRRLQATDPSKIATLRPWTRRSGTRLKNKSNRSIGNGPLISF